MASSRCPRGHDDGWRGAGPLPGAFARRLQRHAAPRPVAPRAPDSTPRDGGPAARLAQRGPAADVTVAAPKTVAPTVACPCRCRAAQTGAPRRLPSHAAAGAAPLQHTVQQPAQPAIGTPPPVMPTQMAPLPNQSPARPMGGEEAFRRQQWEQQQREQQQRGNSSGGGWSLSKWNKPSKPVSVTWPPAVRGAAAPAATATPAAQEQQRREAWGQGQTQQPGFGGFQRPQVPTTQMPTTQMPPVQMPPQNTQRF